MTSRQEDELDLIAMRIADQVKRSDNLRVIRNKKKQLLALAELMGRAPVVGKIT